MKIRRAASLVVATLVVLSASGIASAQTKIFGLSVEGEIEAGGRFYADEPKNRERAKLEEYRDLPQSALLDKLQLRLFRPDERYSVELGGSKWGQEDQEFFLSSERLGLWKFGFEWDQTPHLFSTNARMLATETARGVFTLPSPRPTVNDANYNLAARQLGDIGTRWDTARLFFQLTPTPDIELKAGYTRINKDGDRPMGVPFGFNLIEVLEPIEQTVHDVRFQAVIAREQWQLQFGYTFSLFQNSLTSLTTDSPFQGPADGARGTDTSGNATSTPAAGRLSLPPDNMAHTLSLAGGANLPWWRTRVTGNLSYSLRLQDDDFLPHTRNPILAAAGGSSLVLPQNSLNGNVQVFLVNLNATSRPLPPLTLSAKYRLYDLNDRSDVITFPGTVDADSTVHVEEVRPGRWSYRRQNVDIDGRWRFMEPVALTIGTGWEYWDRNEHREVRSSNEYFAKAALDLTPFEWLLARLTYKPSFRRTGTYNTFSHLGHTVAEEDVVAESPNFQSPLLRKLDEAERDRQKIDLLLQLMPLDTLTTTLTGSWRFDDYFDSALGLQEDTGWSAGIDVGWNPHERLAFTAGYVYESIDQRLRSRFRTVSGSTVSDFVDFDWVSAMIDTIHTVNFGMNLAVVPKLLDFAFNGNYSTSTGQVKTQNPQAPGLHPPFTAANTTSATAKPWPDFEDSLVRLESALKYHFMQGWTASAVYVFEQFRKDDWRTDNLNPFVTGVTSAIWLGNDLKNYAAHIVGLKLGYQLR